MKANQRFLAATLARDHQIFPDAWRAVGTLAQCEELPDANEQARIGKRPGAGRSSQPFVEAACGHPQKPAHGSRGPDRPMANNEGELHVGSFAKKPLFLRCPDRVSRWRARDANARSLTK